MEQHPVLSRVLRLPDEDAARLVDDQSPPGIDQLHDLVEGPDSRVVLFQADEIGREPFVRQYPSRRICRTVDAIDVADAY
jgi:hypothetical protein